MTVLTDSNNGLTVCRVPTTLGKPGKPGKPGKTKVFQKSQGEPGKLREVFFILSEIRENSGKVFSII